MGITRIAEIHSEDDYFSESNELVGKEVLFFEPSFKQTAPKGFKSGFVIFRTPKGAVRRFFFAVKMKLQKNEKDNLETAVELLKEIVANENVAVYPSAIESAHPSVDFSTWSTRVNEFLEGIE